jgi:hypothetical protein
VRVSARVYQTVWSVVGVVFIVGWAMFGVFGGPKWLLIALLAYMPVVPAIVALLVRGEGATNED